MKRKSKVEERKELKEEKKKRNCIKFSLSSSYLARLLMLHKVAASAEHIPAVTRPSSTHLHMLRQLSPAGESPSSTSSLHTHKLSTTTRELPFCSSSSSSSTSSFCFSGVFLSTEAQGFMRGFGDSARSAIEGFFVVFIFFFFFVFLFVLVVFVSFCKVFFLFLFLFLFLFFFLCCFLFVFCRKLRSCALLSVCGRRG